MRGDWLVGDWKVFNFDDCRFNLVPDSICSSLFSLGEMCNQGDDPENVSS